MNRYIISPSATRDLNTIADYFLIRNVEAGEKLFQEFNQKCQKLIRFPFLGRSYNHIKPSLRGLSLTNGYIIFYRVTNEIIEILRVVNGRQDLEALFEDENAP